MGRRGFTLLEVMIAISLMVFVGAVVMGTLGNTTRARDMLAEDDSVQQSARVAMARLARELRLAYLTDNTTAVNTYRTVFVGVDEEPVDRLWFASLSHRRLYRNTRESDQTEITIWGEDDPENPGLSVILHREAPRIDHEPDMAGVVLPLAHSVRRLDLRYLDSQTGEWKEEWDTTGTETPNRLPRAVKLVLVIAAPDPEDEDRLKDHTFTTTILLEYADAMTRSVFASGLQQQPTDQ